MPEDLPPLAAVRKERMPERHRRDILKNVHHGGEYPRHFGPPSGAAPTLTAPVWRDLFPSFGDASALGASHTARHTHGLRSRQGLRRLHDQPIPAPTLAASRRDVMKEYTRFALPLLGGSGPGASADGTHMALMRHTRLGAQPVRYGRFGGIASHPISDTYIALCSHCIACGVWEAVYMLDGWLKNPSALHPDPV